MNTPVNPRGILGPCERCNSEEERYGPSALRGQQSVMCNACGLFKGVNPGRAGLHGTYHAPGATPLRSISPLGGGGRVLNP